MTDFKVTNKTTLFIAMEAQGKLDTVEGLLNEAERLMKDVEPRTTINMPFDALGDLQGDIVMINDDFKKAIKNYEQGVEE